MQEIRRQYGFAVSLHQQEQEPAGIPTHCMCPKTERDTFVQTTNPRRNVCKARQGSTRKQNTREMRRTLSVCTVRQERLKREVFGFLSIISGFMLLNAATAL